jgi:hypothetical protein
MKVNEISSLENNGFSSTNKYFARFIWVYKIIVEKIHAWKYTNFVFFYENVNNYLVQQRNGNISIQIFENLNYLNKNIVSAYFTREKAEKIGKNKM